MPTSPQEIKALLACHEDNPALKFFGVCNSEKRALDVCFREEKQLRRQVNFEKSRLKAADWAALLESESTPAPGPPPTTTTTITK